MKLPILLRHLAYIAPAAIPAIVAVLLVRYYFGTSIFAFIPAWNDEIDYWHEILSFSQNGFSIGYYTVEEIPPFLSSVTGFGTHGPLFPMLYGSVAKITGWFPSSGPLFHLFFLAFAIIIFLSLIRADLYTVLLATITFISFLPIQMYLPTTMQEPLHFAIAIVLAGLFNRYMTDEIRPRWLLVVIPVVITIASLLRPTWSVLFIPYLLTFGTNSQKSKVLLLISGISVLGMFLYVFTLYSAPFPDNFVNNLLGAIRSSPDEALKYFVSHVASNLVDYFSLLNPFGIEQSLRLQFIAAVVFVMFAYFRVKKSNNNPIESVIHICNLLVPFAIIIALYDVGDWRDYRVIAPHVLFSLALFSARKEAIPCMIMLAFSLLAIPSFPETYKQLHWNHFQHEAQNELLIREKFHPLLHYRSGVSPWGNSLLIDMNSLQSFLVGLPAGIGINAVMDWNRIKYPLKSAYVLIEPEIYSQISYKVHLRPIAFSNHGTLYLNLDSPDLN